MAKLRDRGRRALAVSAGVVLVGTLGAGTAVAGSYSSDYDHDYYYSYKCDDYEYSKYFKTGYWFEKHPGKPPVEEEPTEPVEPVEPPAVVIPPELEDLLDGLTPAQVRAVLDAIQEGVLGDIPTAEELEDFLETLPTATGGADATGTDLSTLSIPSDDPAGSAIGEGVNGGDNPEPSGNPAPSGANPTPSGSNPTPSEDPAPSEDLEPSAPSTSTGSDGTETQVQLNSVVTQLPDEEVVEETEEAPADEKEYDDKYERGYYEYGQKKYSYTSYSCYENKEKKHRWYDYREPGKVVATAVRAVPRGGVDTGN